MCPEQKAKSDDLYAIEPLLTLDTSEFYRRIDERRVTACGFGPIAAMVTACGKLGAENGTADTVCNKRRCHRRPSRGCGVCSHCGDVGW